MISKENAEQQVHIIKEQDPNPKVLITFSGREHSSINIQDVTNYRTSLLKHLQGSSNEQRVVLVEGSDVNPQFAQKLKKRDKQFRGYCNRLVAGILSRQFQVEPNIDAVQERRKQIESTDLDTAISTDLLPLDTVRTFYETRMLDEVKREEDFKLEYERHTENISNKVVTITNRFLQIQAQALDKWSKGDFKDIVSTWKQYYQLDFEGNRIREKDLSTYLEEKIKRLLKSPKRGSIFIPFGDNHYAMINDLARKFRNYPSVVFNVERHYSEVSTRIYDGIITSQDVGVDDVLFAQELLGRLLMENVAHRLLDLKKASLLANNFETIFSTMNQIAETFSLEEIKSICENKINLLKLVQNHPLTTTLADLFPMSYLTTRLILLR